jgi:uncharacterized protein
MDSLSAYLTETGSDGCWALTWEELQPAIPGAYQVVRVADAVEAGRRYPGRVFPFYAPDPHAADAVERFAYWHRQGVVGCGELKTTLRWDSPLLDPLLDYVNKYRMPLVFHMEGPHLVYVPVSQGRLDRFLAKTMGTVRMGGVCGQLWQLLAGALPPCRRYLERTRRRHPGYLEDFAGLEARLAQYPDLAFVGHGPLFWAGLWDAHRTVVRLLKTYGNLYADLSANSGWQAITQDRAAARDFLQAFPERILYGTDNMRRALRDFLDTLGLDQDIHEQILSANARRLAAAVYDEAGSLSCSRL